MPLCSVRVGIAFVCVTVAATVAGCSNRAQLFEGNNEGGWFSKPVEFFAKPEWAQTAGSGGIDLGPRGAVVPEDLVNADGSCAPKAVEASVAVATPAQGAPDGSPAPAPQSGSTEAAPVLGGVALGMSECETIRRAGIPSHVVIDAGEQGERKVVLTYSGGSWPGIYTFNGGRLKVVDAVPEPEKPKKAVAKTKKAPQRAKSAAQQSLSRVSVQ